jgi:hypothetical protein
MVLVASGVDNRDKDQDKSVSGDGWLDSEEYIVSLISTPDSVFFGLENGTSTRAENWKRNFIANFDT